MSAAPAGYTADERGSALSKLERYIETELRPENDDAYEWFYEGWHDELEGLHSEWIALSGAVYDMWFAFDYELTPGRRAIDLFLDTEPLLSSGERRCLEQLRGSGMRLYEVEDLSPGLSVTLRDVERSTRTTVHEALGSRSFQRADLVAARVVERGASGQPEIERGILQLPGLVRRELEARLAIFRAERHRENPRAGEADVDKQTAVYFHDAWMSCLANPPIPRLKTTDGEDVVPTRVQFEVTDAAGVAGALGARVELKADSEGRWLWTGKNREGEEIVLGHIHLEAESLTLECHSVERAERGRALIESLGGFRVRHRATAHENLAMTLREQLRSGRVASAAPETDLPRDAQEALVLDHLGRHYRAWVDEPMPALGGQTPRAAAKDPDLRPKLAELIRELEGQYASALKRGEPAYDPSWMWRELELPDRAWPAHPPPLAHERMESKWTGLGELCRTVAVHARARPGFDDAATVMMAQDMSASLDVQRFLRREDAASLAERLPWLVNYELHRRKTFWVDESLAFMLAKTDLDVPCGQLRVPFPGFALVFTDRHVLSLTERMLSADPRCPVKGYLLGVLTVYVYEERSGPERDLHLGLAADTLGADPPHWTAQRVPLAEGDTVERFLDRLAPRVISDPPVRDANPLRGLLHVVLNAILYAVSAGIESELRSSPGGPRARSGAGYTSESVYFLPGAIDISRLRRMQELDRVANARRLLHRFMVRGHWRRPAPDWSDQRMRWIAPYWKGPDLAAVIERAYRLKP
jgi:hypothetical protein